MKPASVRTLLVVVSIAFSIITLECALRLERFGSIAPLRGEHVLRVPDPSRGWVLQPGGSAVQRSMDYVVEVDINARGLRDRPHHYEPAAGTRRIVILGDSFMEAYQVPVEASLPYRLQQLLAPVGFEVVNLGVGGYGTAQELRHLREEGLRYRPEIVVLAFYTGNDIQNNSRALQRALLGGDDPKTYGRPYASATDLGSAIRWTEPDHERMVELANAAARRRGSWLNRGAKFIEPTFLANLAERAIARTAARLGMPPADPKAHFGWPFLESLESAVWDEAWLVTRRLIIEMREISNRAGASFVVMVVPAKLQVEPAFRALAEAQHAGVRFDEHQINRALASFCREKQILLYDPTPEFAARSASGEVLYHQLEDHHWNAAGHELAARSLRAFLDQVGLIH
jgi:hypothetical protein